MERIWFSTFFHKLCVDPCDYPVISIASSINNKKNSEKMTQLMFEAFNVQSFYTADQCLFSLYSTGRTNGIVCEIGDGVSQVVPIEDGNIIQYAFSNSNFGGNDLTDWLKLLLEYRGYDLRFSNKEIIRDIKEKVTYVAYDYEKELSKVDYSSDIYKEYILPDGIPITLGIERFKCPELLFRPLMNGFELDGIDTIINNSIEKCKSDIQKDLYSNIVVAGGSTLFDGFVERLENELLIKNPNKKFNVVAQPNREYAAWIGASILASRDSFKKVLISHDDYNDEGPEIISRRCNIFTGI